MAEGKHNTLDPRLVKEYDALLSISGSYSAQLQISDSILNGDEIRSRHCIKSNEVCEQRSGKKESQCAK